MKKQHSLIWLMLGFVLPLLFYIAVAMFEEGAYTESSRWISECYQIKTAYASSLDKPKLVIASGSNGLFGFNSPLLEKELGMPVVNFATHAGLGLDYILYKTKTVLKSGDTVLLPLEFEMYFNNSIDYDDVLTDYVLSRDLEYLKQLSLYRQVRFLLSVPPERLAHGLRVRFKEEPRILAGYQAATLNHNGDESKYNPSLADVSKASQEEPPPLINVQPPSDALEDLRNFINWCKQKHIKVIAAYPALMYNQDYEGNNAKNTFAMIKEFYKKEDVPILGEPQDFFYEEKMIYDSCYHLNRGGATVRSKKISELLKPYIIKS